MTEDVFRSWLAMEAAVLAELVRDVPALDGTWTPDTLPVLEVVAVDQLRGARLSDEQAVLWRRLMRGIGAVYTRTIAGARWSLAPLMIPAVGARLTPVLDVPGVPVWIEVGELLDRARLEQSGRVLADAYALAAG